MDIEGENGCEAESGGAEGCVAAGKAEKGYGIMKKLSKEGGWWIGGSIQCAEKHLGLKKTLVARRFRHDSLSVSQFSQLDRLREGSSSGVKHHPTVERGMVSSRQSRI